MNRQYQKLVNRVFILLFLCFGNILAAQEDCGLSESEKKDLQNELTELSRPISKFILEMRKFDEAEEKVKDAERERNSAKRNLENTKDSIADIVATLVVEINSKIVEEIPARNIYFRLQVAAFQKDDDLAKFFDQYSDFVQMDTGDNYQKYSLGQFSQYSEAKKLEEYFLSLGAQVFIVAYEDGKRVENINSLPVEYVPR